MKKRLHQRWINNSQRGFTLMELLVAMSLLGLVFAIVFQAFSLSIKVWEKGEATQVRYQRLRAALSLIANQINSAYPLKVKDETGGESYLAFEGRESSLELITSLPLSPQLKGALSFTTYYLKDDYATDTKTLMASERDVLTKGFFTDSQRSRTRNQGAYELIPGIVELKFAYYDNTDSEPAWKEEWEGKKERGLPQAIKIGMKLDHDQTDFFNTIVVPINVSSKFNKIVGIKPKGPFQGRGKTSAFPGSLEKP